MTNLEDPRLTEARNPRTTRIDRVGSREVVRLIQREDHRVPEAVEEVGDEVAELVDRVALRLGRGGRLFYAGAGTSGRLGVLDAAECPPTFGTDPELVQGLIAGGRESLIRSREGVEDDRRAGRRAVADAGVGDRDFLLGIATSGTTPWVRAAVEEAAERGAETGFLSCTEPPRSVRETADVLVTPLVGPEVIAGSTRMKAGTATKLILNALSTGVMVQLGKVYENLMVDLQAVSMKLVDRGVRIVTHLTGVTPARARRLVADAGGSVKTALAMQMVGVSRAVAERLLDAEGGRLRAVVDRYDGSRGPDEPVPYYACYPAEPEGDGEVRRLVDDLAAAVGRVADALDEPGDSDDGWGWSPSAHVAHLVEFERRGVQPRIEGVARGARAFPDWSPPDPPSHAERPAGELLEAFRDARRESMDLLRSAGESTGDLVRRHLSVGDEEMTLWQFLRGVEHHGRAHALRITEHLHPALRESEDPVEPGTGEVAGEREAG